MPTPTKGPRLGGSPQHQRLILANLATALFEHGRITTTLSRAKALRPHAEKLVTFAKRGDLHARRRVLTIIRDKSVVHTLFAEIGPRYAERAGGYTRITKLGPRKGDNAPMAVIELVEGQTASQIAVGEAERARGTRFARRKGKNETQAPSAALTVDEPDVAESVEVADEAPEAVVDEALEADQAVGTDEGSGELETPEPEAVVEKAPEAAAEEAPEAAGDVAPVEQQADAADETSQAEGAADAVPDDTGEADKPAE